MASGQVSQQLTIVLGCIQDQQATVRDTLPTLMSAAVYADKLVVVARESDTLLELSGWPQTMDTFGQFMEYHGADTWDLLPHEDWDVDETVRGESSGLSLEREEALSVAKMVEGFLTDPAVLPLVYDPDGLLHGQAEHLTRLSRPTKVKREADARLGSGLVDSLPSFADLDAEHIVEVRRAFREYLAPFRSYVVETSAALTNHVRDEDATRDVIHELYVGKVQPTVASISREMRDSALARSLLREFLRDPQAFARDMVVFGLSSVASLPLSASIGAAAASELTSIAYNSHTTRAAQRLDRLYLLHELNQYIDRRR